MVAEKICKRNAGRNHLDVKGVGNLQVIKGKINIQVFLSGLGCKDLQITGFCGCKELQIRVCNGLRKKLRFIGLKFSKKLVLGIKNYRGYA